MRVADLARARRWILTSLCFWLNGRVERGVGVSIVRRLVVMSGVPAIAPLTGGVWAARAWQDSAPV